MNTKKGDESLSLFRERLNELYREREAQAAREKRKYSVTAFAAEAGMTRQAMTKYLNGDTSKETNYPCFPDLPMFEKLCDTFSVSADWLLGRTDTRTPDTGTIAVCAATGLSEKSVSILSAEKKEFDEFSNSTSINAMAVTIDTLLKNRNLITLIFNYLFDDHQSIIIQDNGHKSTIHAESVTGYHLSDFESLARIRLLDTLSEFRKNLEPERQKLTADLQAANAEYLYSITDESKEAKADFDNGLSEWHKRNHKKGESTNGKHTEENHE